MREWPFWFVTPEQWATLTERNKGQAEYEFEALVKKYLLEQEIEHWIETEVQKRLLSQQKSRRTKPTGWRVIENKHPEAVSVLASKEATKPKIFSATKS